MIAKHILLAATAAFCLIIPVSGHAADTTPIILKGSVEDAAPVAEEVGAVESTAQVVEETSVVEEESTLPVISEVLTEEPAETVLAAATQQEEMVTHDAPAIARLKWSFDGIFGTYDRGALQRGFQIYKEVCAACHSMSRLAYRNLSDLGYSEAEIKAIAAEAMITDGPDDEGEMYERPGRPSDYFKPPYANIQMAKAVNNGAYPPDLSLEAKARHGGADYIYAILTGYSDAPAGQDLAPGQYWNNARAGYVIAMPPPLSVDQVTYSDGTVQSMDQYARDIAQFMTWAAEPKMEIRKRTGVKVFLFLLIFSAVMYGVKRKIWSDLH